MRRSKTLAKIRAGQPARMCSLGHFIPAFIAHAASEGYDCIWLDLEHRDFTTREVQAMLAYFQLYDLDCMLRPPTLEKSRLYRYLEDGATGLMIPHVSTVTKAQSLADSVKFPPLGDRGLDAAGPDSRFMLTPQDEYVDHANRETFLVVQIETLEAIDNVESIAAVPGVDGMFVGPGDLGLRIRRTDTKLTIDDAYRAVAAAADQHGKFWGCPAGGLDDVRARYAQGAQLIAHGSEFTAMLEHLKLSSRTLDTVYGPRSD